MAFEGQRQAPEENVELQSKWRGSQDGHPQGANHRLLKKIFPSFSSEFGTPPASPKALCNIAGPITSLIATPPRIKETTHLLIGPVRSGYPFGKCNCETRLRNKAHPSVVLVPLSAPETLIPIEHQQKMPKHVHPPVREQQQPFWPTHQDEVELQPV